MNELLEGFNMMLLLLGYDESQYQVQETIAWNGKPYIQVTVRFNTYDVRTIEGDDPESIQGILEMWATEIN
ncbi:hypothetical protein LLE49_20060 [Alicyclobacillus tolerans]|uniref:hypothetical protein n=1 Tax=Alicyclobacillus tolerans TaxID=90970 RepID=UPI001F176986|nr:hypothetical protein [Alicyclobacillus tolerans]MCF8567019.1 hypothetical protein [Alicyclobacillus tolerans]